MEKPTTATIFFADGSIQKIRPTEQFSGDWSDLIEGVTLSNYRHKVKRHIGFYLE